MSIPASRTGLTGNLLGVHMMFIKKLRTFFSSRERNHHSRQQLMAAFQDKYENFQTLLASNTELLEIISDIEKKLEGQTVFGTSYLDALSTRTIFHTARMVRCLENMSGKPYPALDKKLTDIFNHIKPETATRESKTLVGEPLVLPYHKIRRESVQRVGAKNANVGEIKNALGLPTPNGFAITTAAFKHFIQSNHLADTILRMKRKADLIETETILEVSQTIQQCILSASVPDDLVQEIMDAHAHLMQELNVRDTPVNVSLRSSALGEDSTLSFAGQYLTVLNVPPQRIVEDYRRIIASLFAPHAIAYRLHMAITFEDAVMAVACQEMIDASVSGVMFTRNPVNPAENRILIDAVWGLGPFAVDGIVPPDTYILSKDRPPRLLSATTAVKDKQLIASADGQVMAVPVPAERLNQPCLTESQACLLADIGLRLESYFGPPQDVEWAIDPRGRIVILQSRPLRLHGAETNHRKRPPGKPVTGYPLLMEGGEIACTGIGSGPVFHVTGQADVAAFPDGAVLVSPLASSELVMAMPKAKAIVTDLGHISGHMASLSREYMIPTILNLKHATTTLETGVEVTVDAITGRIYQGRVPELINADYSLIGVMVDTPAYQDLRRRASSIVPLHLTDPKSQNFKPENCRTIHDIMRFIHEKAYAEIFQLGDLVTDRGRLSVRLNAPLPLDLYVIDLGGGLGVDATHRRSISADQVTSTPFAALLSGMLNDDLRSCGPRPINIGGFFSVMTRQMLEPPNLAMERFGDRSYAIISDRYMNFSSRIGYHYSVLDSYCGQTRAKNYINFQFKGGAADDIRRSRRARMIERVLSSLGFLSSSTGDRVTARIAKQSAEVLTEKLDRVGRLLIFTRQMDMLMHSDAIVEDMIDAFLKGNYQLRSDLLDAADGERIARES